MSKIEKRYRILIAESSVIVRKGLLTLLKQQLGSGNSFFEIDTPDQLLESIRNLRPEILFVNPLFLQNIEFQKLRGFESLKCIALQTSLNDKDLLSGYDAIVSI